MKVKLLKSILENMADDAEVFARDRDCICLDQVHVVGFNPTDKIKVEAESDGVQFVPTITDVYGGEECMLEDVPSKQAIIFCDCD